MCLKDIKLKYPDRIPVYVNKKEKSDVPDLTRHKYLVPKEMTLGNFVYILRKNIQLTSDKAIFVFVDNIIPPTSESMNTLYEKHANEDGFMYVIYSGESTFG